MEEENGLWCPFTKERCWGKDCACAVWREPVKGPGEWACGLINAEVHGYAQIIDRDQKEDR